MFWKGVLRFGCKNFKKHMDIGQNMTMRGLLRRYSRKYPRVYRAVSAGFASAGIYTCLMLMLPGCDIPLQLPLKINFYKLAALLFRLWDYNIFTSQPHDYLIRLNELLLLAMENQAYSEELVGFVGRELRAVVEENRKAMKSSNYLDLLLYGQIQLQNIIRFSSRLLLSPIVYEHYLWLYQTLAQKLPKAQITIKEDKHIKLFYVVVQYLLNFAKKEQINAVLSSYRDLICSAKSGQGDSKEDRDSFGFWAAKRAFEEKAFIRQLKEVYQQSQDAELKGTIMSIFQQLDLVYRQFSHQ